MGRKEMLFQGQIFVGTVVEAAHWANRAAAISVTRYGAVPSLPFRAEIDQFDQVDLAGHDD